MRRLRRPEDAFTYEAVQVGSFEDGVIGTIVNTNVQAVVIYDGFPFRSRHDLPVLHEFLLRHLRVDPGDVAPGALATTLARGIKSYRPELDLYLLTDRAVEQLASTADAAPFRRIFHHVEEVMEVHLSILDGVGDRYDTPYFGNLKRYAQRPMGTFHALPVARGKSVFRSNWIRDMAQFYGVNLFLAESSATTGGLDSLLEPTGNIKKAQDLAARAFGAQRAYFGTNGTSTSNKIVVQAVCRPGDIVIVDRALSRSRVPRGVQGVRRQGEDARRRRPARRAPAAGPGQGSHPRLPDELGPQVHVRAPPGLAHPGLGRGLPSGRGSVSGSLPDPHVDLAEPPDPRLARRGAPANGAGRLRAHDEGRRAGAADPPRGQHAPADLEILSRRDARGHDPGRVPRLGDHGLRPAAFHVERRARGVAHRLARPRSDAADRELRRGGRLEHAVHDPRRGALRPPAQQDVAQQRARPDQHQQHPERRRPVAQGPRRPLTRDRAPSRAGEHARADRLRGARDVAHDRRPRAAQLQALPRRRPV